PDGRRGESPSRYRRLKRLRPDEGTIDHPVRPVVNAARVSNLQQLRGLRLVDVDTKPGLVISVHKAALDNRRARKGLELLRIEMILFLNPEVYNRLVNMHGRGQIHGVVVRPFLESGTHTVQLRHGRNLARRRDPPDLGYTEADEIDQALRDQRNILRGAREFLMRRLGCNRLLP